MPSRERGTRISKVEVISISPHGIWLSVKQQEYFLPHRTFPWFRNARVSDVQKVTLRHGHHLRWDGLDVDLALDSLQHAERYPLTYR